MDTDTPVQHVYDEFEGVGVHQKALHGVVGMRFALRISSSVTESPLVAAILCAKFAARSHCLNISAVPSRMDATALDREPTGALGRWR